MNFFAFLCLILIESFSQCSAAEDAVKEARDQKLADELCEACKNADLPRVIKLLKSGADPNKASSDGLKYCAMVVACNFCSDCKYEKSHKRCLNQCRLQIVNHLIAAGASLNAVGKYADDSPLSKAVQYSDLAVVKRLLEEGARLTPENIATNLDEAGSGNDDPSVLPFLVAQGPNLCPIDTYKKSLLETLGTVAERYGHLFYLKSHHPGVKLKEEEFRACHEKITLLGETIEFIEDPELCMKTHDSTRSLRRFLLFSIAQMNDKSYRKIQSLKPAWFSRPTVIYKLLLHAALVGNICVVKELMDRLKEMGMKCKPLIALLVLKYLSFKVEQTPVLWQIATENL